MSQAAVGAIEINGTAKIGPKVRGSQSIPTLIGRLPLPLHQLCLLRSFPIISITTKTALGKGAHVLHRQLQPTEWSRKSGLAGRDVTDIRAYELSHRGLGDFFSGFCPKDVTKVSFGPGVARNRCS